MLKAVDIEWDVDDKKDLETLPTEIIIPFELEGNDEAISDYLSEKTGFCHLGYRIVNDI